MKRFELSCRIFIHSLIVYIVFTLPALYMPVIFVVSLLIAFLYGLIAVIIFWLCFDSLWRINDINIRKGYQFLLVSVMLSVLFAFQIFGWTCHWILPGVFSPAESVWESGPFLTLPFLAVIAGWIGVYYSRKRILKQFLTRPNVQ
ncbi:MAG: hypothetical protein ABIS69_01940 [Sediminibacterium sp.]